MYIVGGSDLGLYSILFSTIPCTIVCQVPGLYIIMGMTVLI